MARNNAIKVLETRIENLKVEKESPNDSKKDDLEHTYEKEISELEALVPEIKEKITDTNEMKTKKLCKMKEAIGFTSGLNHLLQLPLENQWPA